MSDTTKYSDDNTSPVDWYIAAYLLRLTVLDGEDDAPEQELTAWENTILIKASHPEEAYEKCLRFAYEDCEPYENEAGQMVKLEFEGLTSLLPIYEALEDGAEIIWVEHTNKTAEQLRQMVKQKHELEIFESEE